MLFRSFTRTLGDVELLVVGNCSGEPADPAIEGWDGAEALIGTPGRVLGPWEGRVLKRVRG